jgi:hypothetical protein
MNEYRFEAMKPREGEVVRERAFGEVLVRADWAAKTLAVSGDPQPADVPAYLELFFHDVFLLLNLATPGAFAGDVAITGGELRVRPLRFDARMFAGAGRLPLADVIAWYDGLQLGTRQVATSAEGIALFELLYLARMDEDEEQSIVRLARAVEALLGRPASLQRLFELREDIAFGRVPVFHPMHDDALDPRVEAATREWIDVADAAAAAVVGALQERIRRAGPKREGRPSA